MKSVTAIAPGRVTARDHAMGAPGALMGNATLPVLARKFARRRYAFPFAAPTNGSGANVFEHREQRSFRREVTLRWN